MGKLVTIEIAAEYLRRPLYCVSVNKLGTQTNKLKFALTCILYFGKR